MPKTPQGHVPRHDLVPQFIAWLDDQPTISKEATDALWRGCHCWLDEDGKHIWFAHRCADGEWTETMLVYGRPLGFKGNGGGWCAGVTEPLTVEPSVSCDVCGFHDRFIASSFGPGSHGQKALA